MILLNNTFNTLKGVSELNPRFLLIIGEQPNALAGPVDRQPTVAINFAMLDLIGYNKDEWAAILGHELAHLKLNHALKGIIRRVPMQLLSRWIQKKTDHADTIEHAHLAMQLFETKFSRDQERACDYLGAIWAVEIGQDPMGAATLHKKLGRLGGDRGIPFLESHPFSSERVNAMEDLAKRLEAPTKRNQTKTFTVEPPPKSIQEIESIGRSLAKKYRREIEKYEQLEKESNEFTELASRVPGIQAREHLESQSMMKRGHAEKIKRKVQQKMAADFAIKLSKAM
jgi:predicted Zn-dependent protease